MSSHVGYVIKVEHLRPHTNADKLQILTAFGNDTCVSLDVKIGDIGVYFPTDLQLSEEFCQKNDLVRRKDENGNHAGGYMDPSKRNVTSIRLRGEKSDGMYLPISCLDYCFSSGNAKTELTVGDIIETVGGHLICSQYIPRRNKPSYSRQGNKTRKKKAPLAPLFAEHADTEQLAYNIADFKSGDLVEITLKMHGTSGRVGYLPKFQGYKRTIWDKIFRREGTPVYDWGYVTGTRRVVLDDFDGGFYGSNKFREQHTKKFEGKLPKGFTVYFEIVGFTDDGAPIMSTCSNKKLNDKNFIKQYGETTVFSYGCEPSGIKKLYGEDDLGQFELHTAAPQSEIYVYRMTMTNEDGDVVEIDPVQMRLMCEQWGVKTVPLLWRGIIPDNPATEDDNTVSAGEWIQAVTERFYDGPDPIGKTHVREGVVARILNRPKFTAYKTKNFSFKCLEGLVKSLAEAPDMEEAQELIEEDTK